MRAYRQANLERERERGREKGRRERADPVRRAAINQKQNERQKARMAGVRPICSVEGCDRKAASVGLCTMHHLRLLRKGDVGSPEPIALRAPADQRFWRRVDKNGPIPDFAPHLGRCWLWTGARNGDRGAFSLNGRATATHRFAYEQTVGPIPDGKELDHLCRVPLCCNPSHLEPVTDRENKLRIPRPTRCPQGHEFTPENTGHRANGNRWCRACNSIASKAAYERRKSKE